MVDNACPKIHCRMCSCFVMGMDSLGGYVLGLFPQDLTNAFLLLPCGLSIRSVGTGNDAIDPVCLIRFCILHPMFLIYLTYDIYCVSAS